MGDQPDLLRVLSYQFYNDTQTSLVDMLDRDPSQGVGSATEFSRPSLPMTQPPEDARIQNGNNVEESYLRSASNPCTTTGAGRQPDACLDNFLSLNLPGVDVSEFFYEEYVQQDTHFYEEYVQQDTHVNLGQGNAQVLLENKRDTVDTVPGPISSVQQQQVMKGPDGILPGSANFYAPVDDGASSFAAVTPSPAECVNTPSIGRESRKHPLEMKEESVAKERRLNASSPGTFQAPGKSTAEVLLQQQKEIEKLKKMVNYLAKVATTQAHELKSVRYAVKHIISKYNSAKVSSSMATSGGHSVDQPATPALQPGYVLPQQSNACQPSVPNFAMPLPASQPQSHYASSPFNMGGHQGQFTVTGSLAQSTGPANQFMMPSQPHISQAQKFNTPFNTVTFRPNAYGGQL